MDVERSLVSRIIATGEIENVIARGIDGDHFADDECRDVYEYSISHLKKYKGAPTMRVIKDKFPAFEPELSEDSVDYLVDRHIVNVKRRLANEAIVSLAEAAEDPERAEEIDIEFLDISRQLATVVPTTAVARFSDMHGRIDRYKKDKKEGNVWGVRMGIPAIDEKTFGIQPHELIVCAGWQGTGKSTLMQHIGFSGYLQSKKILFVSLEMDRGPLLRKFDTMAVNMSYRELKGLELPDEAVERWEKWATDAEEGRDHGKDIVIIDRIGSRTATGIYAETIRHKPDIVIVDYISLLETGRSGTEKHWQQIGQISRELKLNAQTLGIPVIAAAQTNRDSVKEGVKLETIAFSSAIGMDADIVLGLMQDDDMKAEEKMEVVMVKNRDGAPGKAVMDWHIDSMQFGERPQFLRKKDKAKKSEDAKSDAKDGSPFGRKKGKGKDKVVKGKTKKSAPKKAKRKAPAK
jgi:replicative DNA helicase